MHAMWQPRGERLARLACTSGGRNGAIKMETLYSLFPNADELLQVPLEDLGPVLLRLALQKGGTTFLPTAVTEISVADANAGKDYPLNKKAAVEKLINSSWNWLAREGFIEPAPGLNGQFGRRQLTEKGIAVANGQDMQRLREAMDFPKALLHPHQSLGRHDRGRSSLPQRLIRSGTDRLTDAAKFPP